MKRKRPPAGGLTQGELGLFRSPDLPLPVKALRTTTQASVNQSQGSLVLAALLVAAGILDHLLYSCRCGIAIAAGFQMSNQLFGKKTMLKQTSNLLVG